LFVYVHEHEHVHGTVLLMLRLISAPYIILLVSLFCIAPPRASTPENVNLFLGESYFRDGRDCSGNG